MKQASAVKISLLFVVFLTLGCNRVHSVSYDDRLAYILFTGVTLYPNEIEPQVVRVTVYKATKINFQREANLIREKRKLFDLDRKYFELFLRKFQRNASLEQPHQRDVVAKYQIVIEISNGKTTTLMVDSLEDGTSEVSPYPLSVFNAKADVEYFHSRPTGK